jgi:hypothetical protein
MWTTPGLSQLTPKRGPDRFTVRGGGGTDCASAGIDERTIITTARHPCESCIASLQQNQELLP